MSHEEYWRRRQEEVLEDCLKDGDKVVKDIKKAYQKARIDLKKEIEALMFKYMKQTGLGYHEASRLLNDKELYEWRMEIEGYLEAIEKAGTEVERQALLLELNTLAMQSRISKLEAIQGSIKGRMAELASYEESLVTTTLEETARKSYYNQLYTFHTTGEIGEDMIQQITNADLEAVLKLPYQGKNYSERIWKRHWNIADRINEKVVSSVTTGRSLKDLQAELREDIASVATEPLSKSMDSDIERLVRTEVAHAKTQGDLIAFERAGIKRYRFSATLDHKTSEPCRHLDHKDFAIDEAVAGLNCPPMHPRCRSCMVPVSKFRTAKTRAVRGPDGKRQLILIDMSYEEWEKMYVNTEREEKAASVKNNEAQENEEKKPIESDAYKVNFNEVNSRKYSEKIEKLGESKKVSKIIRQRAKEILAHRDRFIYEDLVYIDSNTGETLVSRDYEAQQEAIPTKAMLSMLRKKKKGTIISIHNHPESGLPSESDLWSAYKKGYKYGVIAAHNGNLYRYQITKMPDMVFYQSVLVNCAKKGYHILEEEKEKLLERGIMVEVL